MEGRGRGVCLLGKFLNRSSVNAVQLVLLLTIQKEHLMSFWLQVGQWENLLLSLELKKERAIVINFYPDINWEEVTCKHVEDSVCQSWLEWRESECEQHESFWHLRNVSQYRAKLVPWSVFCLFCLWGWLLGFFVHFVLGGFFWVFGFGVLFVCFVLFAWGFVGLFWLICFGFSVISSCAAQQVMNYGKSQCGWGLILKSFKCPIVSHSLFEKPSALYISFK